MLLIRFFGRENDSTVTPSTEAKEPTILEDNPPADFKGHYVQRVRRLAVPAHAVNPRFKVLLYPYRQGEPLPDTGWLDKERATVAWNDQKDELAFKDAPNGKTSVKINRAGAVLVNLDKPIPSLATGK